MGRRAMKVVREAESELFVQEQTLRSELSTREWLHLSV